MNTINNYVNKYVLDKLQKQMDDTIRQNFESLWYSSKFQTGLSDLLKENKNTKQIKLKNKPICSSRQTKDWRKSQEWYEGGKKQNVKNIN